MKKAMVILCIFLLIVSMCACTQTHLSQNQTVTLIFIHGDENINIMLEDGAAKKVIDILDGNPYSPIFSGVPSCGFDKDVSIKIGNRVFAIACDTCNCIQDLGNMRYFDIRQADMDYIHSLFEEYGGYFPCI